MDNIVWLAMACLIVLVIVRFRHTLNRSKRDLDKQERIQAELQRLRDKRNE